MRCLRSPAVSPSRSDPRPLTSDNGFFWPVFPIVGWGIGVVANAFDVYVAENITEDRIQREIEHLQRQG